MYFKNSTELNQLSVSPDVDASEFADLPISELIQSNEGSTGEPYYGRKRMIHPSNLSLRDKPTTDGLFDTSMVVSRLTAHYLSINALLTRSTKYVADWYTLLVGDLRE